MGAFLPSFLPPITGSFSLFRSFRVIILIIILVACAASSSSASSSLTTSVASQRACNYRSAQQLFDLAKWSLDGCSQLHSLTQIFGDGPSGSGRSGSQARKLAATRFITASLVFTGTVVHVVKESPALDSSAGGTAYEAAVRPSCFLKGRAAGDVRVTGLVPSLETGLCLPVNVEDGNTGLFFVTATDAVSTVRMNENGFVPTGEALQSALEALQCRENWRHVTPVPAAAAADAAGMVNCRPINASSAPPCKLSLNDATKFLRRAFQVYEADLKPECQLGQEEVMRKLMKVPAEQTRNSAGDSRQHHRIVMVCAAAAVAAASVSTLASHITAALLRA